MGEARPQVEKTISRRTVIAGLGGLGALKIILPGCKSSSETTTASQPEVVPPVPDSTFEVEDSPEEAVRVAQCVFDVTREAILDNDDQPLVVERSVDGFWQHTLDARLFDGQQVLRLASVFDAARTEFSPGLYSDMTEGTNDVALSVLNVTGGRAVVQHTGRDFDTSSVTGFIPGPITSVEQLTQLRNRIEQVFDLDMSCELGDSATQVSS